MVGPDGDYFMSTLRRIASHAAADELLAMRALGASWDAAFASACQTIDEITEIASEPDKRAVWPKGSEPR